MSTKAEGKREEVVSGWNILAHKRANTHVNNSDNSDIKLFFSKLPECHVRPFIYLRNNLNITKCKFNIISLT